MHNVLPYRLPRTRPVQPSPGLFSQNQMLQFGMGEGGGTRIGDGFGATIGTYSGSSPTWVNDYIPGVVIDGSSNWISAPAPPWGGVTPSNGMTVLVWVYLASTPGGYVMAASTENGGGNYDWEILIRSDNLPAYYFESGAFDSAGTTSLITGQWNHIGFSVTLENVYFYINGVVTATDGFGAFNYGTTTNPILLGGHSQFSGRYLPVNSRVGPFAMWNRGLHPSEVMELYTRPESLFAAAPALWAVQTAATAGGELLIRPNWDGGFNEKLVGGMVG